MELKNKVDKWLSEYFKNKRGYNKKIYEAMEYSLNAGGKRIRPILMILSYKMFKKDYEKILPIACSIEMIHTYSLIHDDLPCMDNDDLRRGKPTNHKVFGESIAVLAGDALLNEAMDIMFDYCSENKEAVDACKFISNSAGTKGMISGQVVDILGESKKLNKEEIKYMYDKKTGALIKAPIVAGAMLGGATEKEIQILDTFAEKLGLCFQIKDDILDVLGDEIKVGKNLNNDKNKNNLLKIYSLEKSKELCQNLTKESLELLNEISRNTEELKNMASFLLKRDY